ncbi:hypothetical protein FQA47_014674 [Oryzias melastigma]|uniref:Uncharacterized protein n=1 Tax=Oryzias melastigma TaxID=30732 RepID=A0A834BYX2_ORYME|nr:hypothetical protein FQA47_014674 [Oryzias melastigma]
MGGDSEQQRFSWERGKCHATLSALTPSSTHCLSVHFPVLLLSSLSSLRLPSPPFSHLIMSSFHPLLPGVLLLRPPLCCAAETVDHQRTLASGFYGLIVFSFLITDEEGWQVGEGPSTCHGAGFRVRVWTDTVGSLKDSETETFADRVRQLQQTSKWGWVGLA